MEHVRTYEPIAKKFRRALRNQTGATFTLEQLQHMAEAGILKYLAELESDELCPSKNPNSSITDTGSTSGGTAKPRTSGRSLDESEARSFIAALGKATLRPQKAS
jgi:hypothetical protein